jgi:DNA-binding transcriptional MerR regulator
MGVPRQIVLELTGLTPRALQFYVDHQIITPRLKRGSGPGTRIEYIDSDIVLLMICKELSDFGMTVSKIKSAVDLIKKDKDYKQRYEIYKLDEARSETAIFVYIFKQKDGNFSVRFKDRILEPHQFKKGQSSLMIDYRDIVTRVQSK